MGSKQVLGCDESVNVVIQYVGIHEASACCLHYFCSFVCGIYYPSKEEVYLLRNSNVIPPISKPCLAFSPSGKRFVIQFVIKIVMM